MCVKKGTQVVVSPHGVKDAFFSGKAGGEAGGAPALLFALATGGTAGQTAQT
jgi:hypothetical protein